MNFTDRQVCSQYLKPASQDIHRFLKFLLFPFEKLMRSHTKTETELILTDIFLRFSPQPGFCTHTHAPSCRKSCAFTVKCHKPYLWHPSKTEHGPEDGRDMLVRVVVYVQQLHIKIVLVQTPNTLHKASQ